MLVFVEVEVAFGFFILGAKHAVGRGELGHNQAAAGQIANEAAEDSVGDAGHRGKHGCRSDFDRAKLQSGWNWNEFVARRTNVPFVDGIVPVFPHVLILTGPSHACICKRKFRWVFRGSPSFVCNCPEWPFSSTR